MIPYSIKQLSYFVAAAEHGGTAQAAQALNVSQPSISMAIKHLEETLGLSLFVRHHAQGLTVTPAGRRKLVEARHILAQANAWISSPDGESARETWIDVGCFVTLGPSHMPAIIRRFREVHPNVQVRLREADLEELDRFIENGTLEAALMYDLDPARSGHRETVAELRPHAVVGADHALASRTSVSLRELGDCPFILINLPHSRDYFLSLFRLAGVTPRLAMETPSLEMVRGMVANGHGVSLLTTRPQAAVSYDGRPLVTLAIEDPVPPQKVVIATPRHFPPTWLTQAFVQAVRQHFRDLPPLTPTAE